jgi:hypothetical protein
MKASGNAPPGTDRGVERAVATYIPISPSLLFTSLHYITFTIHSSHKQTDQETKATWTKQETPFIISYKVCT